MKRKRNCQSKAYTNTQWNLVMATTMDPNSNAGFPNWNEQEDEKNKLGKENKELKEKYQRLLKDFQTIAVSLTLKDSEIQSMKTSLNEKETIITANREKINNLEKDVENLKKENSELRNKIKRLEDELENLLIGNGSYRTCGMANEFLRLVKIHIIPSLDNNLAALRRSLYGRTAVRLDTLKERVISNIRHDQELLQTITAKFEELPSKLFEPWLSDFLESDRCPELSSFNYESAVFEINDSNRDEGSKEDALDALELLRDLYAMLGEPFGGNRPIGGEDSLESTPRKRQKLFE